MAFEQRAVELGADVLVLELVDDRRQLLVDVLDLLPSHEAGGRFNVLLDAHVGESHKHLLAVVDEGRGCLSQGNEHPYKLQLHRQILVLIAARAAPVDYLG